MEQAESQPRLIHTRRGAVIWLCVTAYITALTVRDVLWQPHYPRRWLLDLYQLVYYTNRLGRWHFSLPVWAVVGANLAFYATLLWGGMSLYRDAHGKERVLVAGWVAAFLLGLIQIPISASAATALQPVRALLMAVAFAAAVAILLKMPAGGYPRAENQPPRNSFEY